MLQDSVSAYPGYSTAHKLWSQWKTSIGTQNPGAMLQLQGMGMTVVLLMPSACCQAYSPCTANLPVYCSLTSTITAVLS